MNDSKNSHRIAAVGMFDGVHAGHRYLFSQLKAEGKARGLSPVAVTFPCHPLSTIAPEKAPALLSTPTEKEALIRAEGVEPIFIRFDERLRNTSAQDFMLMLRENYGVEAMLLGFNNRFGHNAPTDFSDYRILACEAGIELLAAKELPAGDHTVSSSAIRAAIGRGDMTGARSMLQRPYEITGTVGHGHQIGRTLGFPTANITPENACKIIPAEGVYAAKAITADGRIYPAVVNIGHRPTVDHSADAPLSMEANLIGFEGDLYNTPVTLQFIERIRPEHRFPDLTSLRKAIGDDRAAALRILNQ